MRLAGGVGEIFQVLLHQRGVFRRRFFRLILGDGITVFRFKSADDLRDTPRPNSSQNLTALLRSIGGPGHSLRGLAWRLLLSRRALTLALTLTLSLALLLNLGHGLG